MFISFNGPPPHFWPISRSRPSNPPRARAFASAQPTRALSSFSPAHAYVSDRVSHVGPRGERMPATPAGWRPVAPASTRLAYFQAPAAPLLPAFPIFPLPRCISPSPRTELCSRRPRHRSSAGEIGRRWSTVAHNQRTSLRLALRHPVLAAGSPFEQGKATLSGFAAVGHGAAALDLAEERASPFLLYPLESPSRVRHLLADPVRAPSCPVVAGNGRRPAGSCRAAMAPRTPRVAWPSPLDPLLGQVGLGPEP